MLNIAYAWFFCLVLIACASKPSNELEDISKDVLKAHQGIEIEIKPMPKEAK